ncbi:hypothetical protein IW140_000372 [Coemansia sp. RSA 1813]|nr:hypothetical protein EV178_000670 [Coemansia sp. RSA 1646]KAJ1773245.1 hypothetical protein LPJ74_000755 [Coemansia sp. RSA 1843]KAJ2092712.1 hypothetical protein IW138_000806 [Coemansia sp. RSA 986]KAJ2217790.1 hypothetical protein EV179_000276 [Coemansia sp. RSA 487]KAJ2572974.1 hypothetical protein IW140_000372 [Coemansia sp. RSA 1813]
MKFKLGISVLIVALATTAQPAIAKRHRGGVYKREITIGEQSLTVSADATAAHTVDSAAAAVEEYVPAVSAYQVAQPATVIVDGSLSNAHALPLNVLQPGQSLSQVMLSPQIQAQGAVSNQRLADTTQIVIQAPAASSAAPVTVVQTVTANAVPTTVVQLPAALPVATNQAAAGVVTGAAPVAQAQAPAPAVTPAVAPATAPAITPAMAQAATAPVAQAAVPVPAAAAAALAAAPAQLAVQAAAPGTVQAPAANLSEGVVTQPIAATGAGVAEPAGAAVYAQQQFYPIAAGAVQPIYQQPAAAFGNSLQPAIILNGNQALPQAVIPLDQSLAELLTQSAAPASASLSSKALHSTSSATLDSVADNDEDDGASATAAPEDDNSVPANPRRSSRAVGRVATSRAKYRQNKAAADDTYADDAEAPNYDAPNPVQDDQADSDPVGVSNTGRKSKATTGRYATSEPRRKSANRDSAPENQRLASVANFKATSSPNADDTADDASVSEYSEAPAYNRAHASRTRYATGGLRAEALRIKSEASAEAREAVLSEVRAEASAEAALQASSELNIGVNTIVRDEEASSERTSPVYDSPQDYHTRERLQRANNAKETDYPDTYSGGGVGRYASDEKEDTSTWDVHHAVSWASAHSTGYDDDSQTTSYHPYEHSYDDYDKYAHNSASYDEASKDSTENGDWKVRYNGPHPTVYSASDDSSSSFTVLEAETRTYSDNYYTPYSDSQSETVHDYDSQSKPFNFVNMRADAALSRDAAGISASSADSMPHAVNELDPLSYGTQGYPPRDSLPFVATPSNGVASAHPSLMVIGIPQPMAQPATSSITAAPASTVMVTRMVTPAIEVVLASSDSN